MAAFTFTSPEGKRYTVNGPAGATKEQAFQVLQQQIAGGTAQAAAPTDVPQTDGAGNYIPSPKPAASADPSLVDRIIGGGETALALATGATGGTLGTIAGAAKGLVNSVRNGTFGTAAGADQVEQAAGDGAQALTYQPRTQTGQDYTQATGDAINSALPVMMMPELAGAAAGAKAGAGMLRETAENTAPTLKAAAKGIADRTGVTAAASAARDLVTAPKGTPEPPIVAQIRKVSPAIADRVQRTLERNPAPVDVATNAADPVPIDAAQFDASRVNVSPPDAAAPTPGTKGSVGAAGTDMATQREQVANQVGIDLTQGQATRDPSQLRFEQETAKGEAGGALRDRYSDQNEQILKHFDNLVDQTGKESPDLAGTGRSVDDALTAGLNYDKGRVRVAYKEAEKSAEGAAPVTLHSAIQFLNDSAPDAAVSPLLDVARKRAIRLGAAVEDADGNLVPQPTTVQNAELLRRAIGNATDYEPTNVRNSAILKGAIDSATEPAIGPLYRNARRLRENLAKKYEDRGVVASLLNTKRGMADRKVAIADVFKHSILNASREDVSAVRRALTHAKDAPAEVRGAGQQAWRDLQGETANWLKEQAFSSTATDQRGNTILSPAKLDRAIKRLDADGRLETIFGKQGAQHMRDLNDLAKVIYTTPPGAVNHSNTASVLLAAMAEAGATSAFTGLPVPVLSTLRLASKYVKNRQLQKRIEIALTRGIAESKTKPPARPTGATLH